MKLHTLKRSKGIVSKSKRIWRWNGSGKGNYSTKGLKWQKSRSGSTTRPFFEWWQTSIVQRIPKARGFKRYFKLVKEVVIVNLWHLDSDVRIIDGMEITKAILKDFGYIKSVSVHVKVLGNGDWTKKVSFVDVDSYSKSAQEKIVNPAPKSDKPKNVSAPKEVKKSASKTEKPTAKKVVAKTDKPAEAKLIETEEVIKKPADKKLTSKTEKPTAKKVVAKTDKPAAKKTVTKTTTKKPVAKK